jgi:hypothetical protein
MEGVLGRARTPSIIRDSEAPTAMSLPREAVDDE